MSMLESALSYVNEGFKVFPVKLDKTPLTPHGLKDATMIQLGVKDYWTKYPDAGIGLVTNGFIVVDFDKKNGGTKSHQDIIAKYGPLPKTRTHRTGGGGLHYIYKNPNGTNIRNTTALAGYSGVDIRANDGYIVVPPSPHISGKFYRVLDNSPVTTAPEWLMTLLKTKLPAVISTTPGEGIPIPEGQRDATLASLAGTMRHKGMSEAEILAALQVTNQTRCIPPMSDKDIQRIAKSVARYEPGKIYPPNNLEILESLDTLENLENLGVLENSRSLETEKVPAGKYKSVSSAVEKWLKLHQDETFDLDTISRQLGIGDPAARNLLTIKLSYEVKRKNLEKSNRLYRYINNDLLYINWYDTNKEVYLPLVFPSSHSDKTYFGFQDSVRMSQGSAIVIAGQTNAGKSCLARNFVWDNMDISQVRYLVSQTTGHAFHRYADNMTWAKPMKDGKPKFELVERYENFQDLVLPDGLTLVDWLDADKIEYYQLRDLIKTMRSKLVTGGLIVFIQKNSDKVFGDGGEKTAAWADLYISLSYNREKNFNHIDILKAKEWIGNIDPNGKSYGFEITNYGSQLSNIREVKRCTKCWGSGKDRHNEDCSFCNGIGWVDGPVARKNDREEEDDIKF